jgi:hypothetical protein
MRSENGMRFDRCVGLQDRGDDGEVFDANVLTCDDKPLSAGESILVGGRPNRYDGDDSLGNSIFTALEPFPEFERVEKPYKDSFIVLELYPKRNGRVYVLPYVQSGETSSGTFNRRVFGFAGEFETREAAEQAGMEAGQKEIDAYHHDKEQQTHSSLRRPAN